MKMILDYLRAKIRRKVMGKILKMILEAVPPVSKKYAAAIACGLIVLFKQELSLEESQITDLVLICATYIGGQAAVDVALVAKGKKS